MASFADRLADAVRRSGTPLVVGLDPRPDRLPDGLLANSKRDDPAACSDAQVRFCCEVIDVVAGLVPAVKPQMAFFERCGPTGMAGLAEVIGHAKEAGLLVLLDGKRNDIGSTAEAYAAAYLGRDSAWGADALTVSPYLGADSLQPFVDRAVAAEAGIFVLVKTSNPGGGQFQDLVVGDQPVYAHVADMVVGLANETRGTCGYGSVGAVVGATYPQQLADLRARMPGTWILVPGFGAQGGQARDVAGAFDDNGLGALVNSARDIIFAHAREEYAEFAAKRWPDAVRAAAEDAMARLAEATPAGRLQKD